MNGVLTRSRDKKTKNDIPLMFTPGLKTTTTTLDLMWYADRQTEEPSTDAEE